MTFSAPNELLQWLAENQFLPPPAIEEIRPRVASFPDSHALVKEFVGRNWLKPYQANQILQNKAETLVIGPFRILERIGEGAMGQVFKAWNIRLGRFAAIKMILKELMTSNKARERFRREMETASRLDHPNIVLVRDGGEVDGRPFIVMDFVEGLTLARMVKQQGPLAVPLACEYIRQAALGMQQAFERDVIHRDIKPGNLIVARDQPGAQGVLKIMDFGLARWNSDRDEAKLTQMGNILGTIDYISPEQAENSHAADIRSDIYSLGCTLYFLLAGRPPFGGGTVVEKVSPRLLGELPGLQAVRPDVPAALESVLHKMLARRPEGRYQQPREVAAALEAFARPPAVPVPMPAPPVAVPVVQALPVKAVAPTPAIPVAYEASPLVELATDDFPLGPAEPIVAPVVADQHQFQIEDSGSAAPAWAPLAQPALAGGPNFAPSANPLDMSSAASGPAPARSRAKSSGRFSFWFLLVFFVILAGAAVGGGLVIFNILKNKPEIQSHPPGASLKIQKVDNLKLSLGKTTRLVVRVERKGFSGPVKLGLKNAPVGLQWNFKEMPAGKDNFEFPIMVSFDRDLVGEKQLVLEATALELRAEYPLTLSILEK